MDRNDNEGPTALVETDGSMRIVKVTKFGPGITDLDDQQEILDDVVGQLAPVMKPMVAATSIDVEGVEPHPDLTQGESGGAGGNRASRRDAGSRGPSGGRTGGGSSQRTNRGDR
jgi:hypothetical protein